MESTSASALTHFKKVELIRYDFNWNSNEHSITDSPTNTYTASVMASPDGNDNIQGICKFTMSSAGNAFNNYTIECLYYYNFYEPYKGERSRKTKELSIVRKIIWTKFFELSKIILQQADINSSFMPLIPDKVDYSLSKK